MLKTCSNTLLNRKCPASSMKREEIARQHRIIKEKSVDLAIYSILKILLESKKILTLVSAPVFFTFLLFFIRIQIRIISRVNKVNDYTNQQPNNKPDHSLLA